ncbi:hypothetical protein HAX54_051745 [Datura stramonium]|uniref:Uncharacterized protein n=1 Tax=Datura stramonium TaxID=4076 RepID=A0ABS8WRS0_DATST|nr:hypothetical protein [Datura stramonium]
MSSIISDPCDDNMEHYAYNNVGYEYDYGDCGGYVDNNEHEQYSYGEDEDYEGSHNTYHGYGDDLRYNSSSHVPYESYNEGPHENGSCDEYVHGDSGSATNDFEEFL